VYFIIGSMYYNVIFIVIIISDGFVKQACFLDSPVTDVQ